MEYTENIIYFPYILTSSLKLKVEDSGSLRLKIGNRFKCNWSWWFDQNGAGEKDWKWRSENGDYPLK
jgi:hypothetical protein